MIRILTIGGSDSSGGAGIEADIKTITALGGYAMTAITAVTVQDTQTIAAITPIPPALVAQAITMVAHDIGIDAIKIGMLGSAAMVRAVATTLATLRTVPIVLDPVMAATSGTTLLDPAARTDLLTLLLPLATLITPNRAEAATLSGHPITTINEAIAAARALCARGARAVLLKGGHFEGPDSVDHLITETAIMPFTRPRIATRHTHGTGCTLASAIAVGLAQGHDLPTAIEQARTFLQNALQTAPGYGTGHGPLGHASARRPGL